MNDSSVLVARYGDPDFIAPGSAEHGRFITASKVSSVLGLSRWESAYSLWHRLRGDLPTGGNSDADIFRVGHAFEAALAELWRLENPGWRLSPGEVQFVTSSDRWGFPAMATVDRRASRGRARRLVEFKTARDLSVWGDPTLDGDCPIDFVTQVIFQMMVSGHTDQPANLSVMGPFFQHYTYQIPFDEKVAAWITRECQDFWNSVQSGNEPELDDSLSTYEAVRAMHPDITPELARDVPEPLWLRLQQAHAESKQADTELRGLKSKVLSVVGDAQFVTVNGEKVATRRAHKSGSVNLVIK